MSGQLGRRTFAWLLFLMIGITIVALGAGAIALKHVETSLIGSAGESLALAAVDIAGKLDLLLAGRYGDIQMMAQAPVLRGRDVAAMTAYLQTVQQAYPVYLWLAVTDTAGIVTAATDQATVGVDHSSSAWFQAVREGDGGHVGEAEASEETEGIMAVSFAATIRGQSGEFLGVVISRVGLPVLEDVFAQTATALQAQRGTAGRIEYQFLDRMGTVIADSVLREAGQVNLKQRGLPSALRFDSSPPGYVEEVHQRRAVPVITGYAQTKGGLSWGVLVRMDRSDILVPIRTVLWKVGSVGAVVWLPMFVLLLWTSGRLKRSWTLVKKQEEWLAATLASVGDAVIATDHKGCVAFMNPLAVYLTGWEPKEAKGTALEDVFKIVHEDTRRPVGDILAAVTRAGEPIALAKRALLMVRDGTELPVEGSGAPIKDRRGAVTGVVLAFRDDSTRRRMEKRQAAQLAVSLALTDSDRLENAAPRLLQAVCETVGWEVGLIWMVDGDAQVLRNEGVWHAPSIQADSFLALSRASTFSPGIGLPGRVWASGKPAWITDVLKDSNFPRAPAAMQAGLHAAFGFPVKWGSQVYGVVEFFSHRVRPLDADLLDMMADIGIKIGQFVERQRAAESARASEERFRLAVDHATDAIIYLDGKGVIRWTNQQAAVIADRAIEELAGCTLVEVFSNQPIAKAHLASIGLGRPVPALMEFEVFLRDGTSRWLEVTGTQVKNDEQVVGWLLVARDRTECKQTEQQLRQSEKRASLGMLLDGIAHEINNPLFMISGNVQLAREEIKQGRYESLDEELAGIQAAAQRATQIVQRTLAVSRSAGGRRESCQVGQLLQQTLDLAANDLTTRQIQMCTNIPADLPPVKANPNELAQVFLSLITNAREAMISAHGKGTLTVTAALAASPCPPLPVSGREARWIEARIQDDGPGIVPELQARVFEPFFTIKPAGQSEGLGLSIAHRIVSELGGTLSLESVLGQGATFIVRLPAMEESAQNRNAEASSSVQREERELLSESTSHVTR
nr:PAS domain S-box protein [Nitrospirota bacterium]